MDAIGSFGIWVRRLRRSADLTQTQLAGMVNCAPITVRKIEGDLRSPSPQMAERLADALCVSGPDRALFVAMAAGRGAASIPHPRVTGLPGVLPAPVTTFIGREVELAEVIERSSESRVITLTGPAGVGKSRLALEAGHKLRPRFRHGAYLVPLVEVQRADHVPAAIASVLGVRETRGQTPEAAVREFLAPRQVLLILDNFEHVLPAGLFVAELLAGCPELRLVITSTIRLRLYGEHEFALAPLPCPDQRDARTMAGSPAVQLFCERARAVQPSFQLTPSSTSDVAAIVSRLDGLPLAIELAAARVRLFSPQDLLGRLERRLPLLSRGPIDLPARHQSLQGAIAWTHALLPIEHRALFNWLAVFAAGFTVDAAEAVCAGAPDATDVPGGLAALLDHSLLTRQSPRDRDDDDHECCGRCPARLLHDALCAEPRFGMLGVIREHALTELDASGERRAAERAHARHFAGWVMEATAHLEGPDQHVWMGRLERESDNVRTALDHLLACGQTEHAARLACALGPVWQRRGRYREGRQRLEQMMRAIDGADVGAALHAHVLQTAALLAYRQGLAETAADELERSLALYRAAAEPRGIARVLFDQGWMALDAGQFEHALALNAESRTLARAAADAAAEYRAATNMGWAHFAMGHLAAADHLFDEALGLARSVEHTHGIAVSLVNLGWIALYEERLEVSAGLVRDGVLLCHVLGEREVLAEGLEVLAMARACAGDLGSAAELCGAADALWEALQIVRPPALQTPAGRPACVVSGRDHLAEPDLAARWRAGHGMRLSAVVARVLHQDGVGAEAGVVASAHDRDVGKGAPGPRARCLPARLRSQEHRWTPPLA